jgi:hypothetical protein
MEVLSPELNLVLMVQFLEGARDDAIAANPSTTLPTSSLSVLWTWISGQTKPQRLQES